MSTVPQADINHPRRKFTSVGDVLCGACAFAANELFGGCVLLYAAFRILHF